MLKNYWRIAWRNLTRNKVYAFINLFGLALGICGCLVLFLISLLPKGNDSGILRMEAHW